MKIGSEALSCAVLLDDLPGDQLKRVRKPSSGLLGMLERRQRQLIHKLVPSQQTSTHIRGNKVARDYLLQGLITHSHCAEFSFVVTPDRCREFQQWTANYSPHNRLRSIKVQSVEGLLGPSSIVPDVWLDLHGTNLNIARTRDQRSSKVYPITSIQHGLSSPWHLYDKFLRTMITPSYACDSLICTSRACQKALRNLLAEVAGRLFEQFGVTLKYDGRLDIIPLCVDTDTLRPREKAPVRKQLGIPQDALVLLYIGYIALVKADLTPLLPIIRHLVDRNAHIRVLFVIAGTGPEPYSKSLMTTIGELNLGRNVTLLREVSDTTKELLLGSADIFVAPCDSMAESFGLTPVEAMSCGLPQVVADWNGYRDTVSHNETGFLIPTCWGRCDADFQGTGDLFGWIYDHSLLGQSVVLDLDSMEKYLQKLISQPHLRATMSERSRARAVAEFSYAAVARRYDELWTELCAIAASLQPYPKGRRFDQPAYFNCFGHFASKELSDKCLVRLSSNGSLSISRLVQNIQSQFPGLSVLNEGLLQDLMAILSTTDHRAEGTSVQQLVSQTSNGIRSSDTIRRHILFLLKHGKAVLC